jgi:hypothetical protein
MMMGMPLSTHKFGLIKESVVVCVFVIVLVCLFVCLFC